MQIVNHILRPKISFTRCAMVLVAIYLLDLPQNLHAQETPAIVTYDRSEYQGGNKNWGFAEDEEGNLYVANTKGIMIYNGLAWQMVYLPNHRVPRSIYRGYDGRIYAGGFETIGYIDRTDTSNG